MFWSIKCIYNIEYKIDFQNEKTGKLWVFCALRKEGLNKYIKLLSKMKLWDKLQKEEVVVKCFEKKNVLRNFKKFTGKHFCWSLLLNKIAGFRLK